MYADDRRIFYSNHMAKIAEPLSNFQPSVCWYFWLFFRQNHIENAVFVFCFNLVSINAGNIEPPLVRTIGAFPTDVVFLGFVNLFLLMNSGQRQRIAVDIQLNFALFKAGQFGFHDELVIFFSNVRFEAANGFFDMSALADGSYTIELTMEGGSGRASIQSPAQLAIADGAATAILEWSSPNYDYMLVNGEKYLPVNTEGNSVFEVPVEALDAPLTMIGDTVAMSTPHEVEYTVTFHSETLESAESGK